MKIKHLTLLRPILSYRRFFGTREPANLCLLIFGVTAKSVTALSGFAGFRIMDSGPGREEV